MKLNLNFSSQIITQKELVLIPAYTRNEKNGKKEQAKLVNSNWPKEFKDSFSNIVSSENFKGKTGEQFIFHLENGTSVLACGLGEKAKLSAELLRNEIARIYKGLKNNTGNLSIMIDGFKIGGKLEKTVYTITESLLFTEYEFNRYKSESKAPLLQTVDFFTDEKKKGSIKIEKALQNAKFVAESVNFGRDLVNEPPNHLNSETMAKQIEKDASKLSGVKIKILDKAALKKEKMNLFLSVNAGSHYAPRLVHLTYTPKKATKKTKHLALVGKGLTFDTGGYSIKPSASMVNMKFDMAGAATAYAAFRAAVLCNAGIKISCILGLTDNAIGPEATMPDSIVTGRNGKTVEILNTDAEGRLVLADCLDYTCDQNPDAIIDVATLTGAVLVALGGEICGLMGNDQKLAKKLLDSAGAMDEYMWQLPIINEFKEDIKSPNADLKNIGNSRFGGSAKAAAFLGNFIKNDIPWAHLDIAGIADGQGHLQYCPKKGASGLIVRTLAHYLISADGKI